MDVGPNGSPNATFNETDVRKMAELERLEFYKTYDVMTGVRIAATLGGFFGLMVILVLYKSKSKTEKALEDPDFTAAAVADAEEEEERQLAAALEATTYQQLNPRKARRSLDTSSMPAGWIRTTRRFSSIGGYSSLIEPPIGRRLPSSVEEDSPFEEDVYSHLDVPRRSSNITCSSSGSSYLERRDSSLIIGYPALPAHKSRNRRQSSPLLPEIYDFYYPIDIRVIQPTPGGSPCGSDRTIYDRVVTNDVVCLNKPRKAPLASISSCNDSSLAVDSVFFNGEDTDNEIEPFSTDSEASLEGACSHHNLASLADIHCCLEEKQWPQETLF